VVVKDISITELRKNLQASLAMVQRGKRLRVTSRGKIIAEITPPSRDLKHVDAARQRLQGSVLRYDDPLASAFAADEWEMHR
jgi:antitoxin (DNA-binding transcriptional repressor) of toxin-antitoxin stability system